ncbi:MAG: hypothetical protein ACOH10_04200 [Rhodoglobus sp.]
MCEPPYPGLASVGMLGLLLVHLDTVNPMSRTPLNLPLVAAPVGRKRYVVSMLGPAAAPPAPRIPRTIVACAGARRCADATNVRGCDERARMPPASIGVA